MFKNLSKCVEKFFPHTWTNFLTLGQIKFEKHSSSLIVLSQGPSIKYVSIFEGGGVSEMLTLADMGEGGFLKC